VLGSKRRSVCPFASCVGEGAIRQDQSLFVSLLPLVKGVKPRLRSLLRLGDFAGSHSLGDSVEFIESQRTNRIYTQPLVCFYVVSRHTTAFVVHATQIRLSRRESLLGGLSIPLGCLNIVLRHTPTDGITARQICTDLADGSAQHP
jgi:hypothetical protein